MDKQMIISVGREFGSGGHVVAQQLAKHYNIPLYDKNILHEMFRDKNVDASALEKYDEVPKSRLFSRTVNGYNNSPQENVAKKQFTFLKEKAEQGESFVVIGRCAETVLKEFPALISIFILGDRDKKIERTATCNNISKEEAERMIEYHERKRKAYHNYYCEGKWGDSRNYELSINSSKLGIDETTNMVIDYIEKRQKSAY